MIEIWKQERTMRKPSKINLLLVNWSSFWERVDKTDSCWLWKGQRNPAGYGIYDRARDGVRISWLVHRVVYTLEHGPIPDHLSVCHRCEDPACVNPAHLKLGTTSDNLADAVRSGRWQPGHVGDLVRGVRGDLHPASDFTDAERRQAIDLVNKGGFSQYEAAAMMGCHRQTISRWLKDHARK